ncbi:RagB/SusD family nutrient uptake outer membrane protein [Larkinella terrae]|uniref:RagB/SusD family nutrient uptake outer membrane protein n=2 Tax=Larkinella terrae TaxID=2025311 RepID=A0A7K0EFL9_9BACT|nr:RagB/SusD family nutrient uptake outer membrane protein [Larkinella terrae]
MKYILTILSKRYLTALSTLVLVFGGSACKDTVLDETPRAFLNPDVVLVDKTGFETAIIAIHAAARDELFGTDTENLHAMNIGTDAYMPGAVSTLLRDYNVSLTPTLASVDLWWEWAYLKMLPRSNIVLDYADKPTVKWASEAEKNAIVAEARFFRGYTYSILANLYGGVPLVAHVETTPKTDYTRATRQEVLDFARQDLEFASQWLPKKPSVPGRIVKAAADHFLSEVYLALGSYDKAIEAASAVINDGSYKLMTQRFGSKLDQPGDVFSDLFRDKNQNLAANTETIWALQFEYQTPGGVTYTTPTNATAFGGNSSMRAWGAGYHNIKDPEGKSGMVVCDSLGRPVGWVMGTPYATYDVWKEDWNDMRNSSYNIRRTFYYNNNTSRFFKQKVDPIAAKIDTLNSGWYYPYTRKLEGDPLAGNTTGRTFVEFYKIRLAETYLLRAEAYIRKGDKQKAADDLNVLRNRAKAKPVTADRATLDYVLDERVRELIMEEPRRRTLIRFGFLANSPVLVDRVKKFNTKTGSNIAEKHELFPIPQKFIDANLDAKIEQNPGY